MDIGEVETSGKDKSRQPVPGKSRSLKEVVRSEGMAEGASKPVRLGAQGPRGGHPRVPRDSAAPHSFLVNALMGYLASCLMS